MLKQEIIKDRLNKLSTYASLNTIQGRNVLFTASYLIILIVFTILVIWQNNRVQDVGKHLLEVSNPVTKATSNILVGLERVSTTQRGYFITKSTEYKDERTTIWDGVIYPSMEDLQKLKNTLSPEDKRSIESLETLLREYRHHQDDLELYFEQNASDFASEDESFEDLGEGAIDSVAVMLTFDNIKKQKEVNTYIEEFILTNIKPLKEDIREILTPLKANQETILSEDLQKISIDISKANSTIGIITAFFALLAVFSSVLVIRTLNRSLSKPIKQLEKLANGEITEDIEETNDEMNEVIRASNKLKDNIKNASDYAMKVGDGVFDVEYQPVSDQDVLGNSLIQMSNRLQEVAEQDEKRNWSTKGLAHFADILRESSDIKDLASNIISELVMYLNANQGEIYLVQGEENDKYLELMATYAFNTKRTLTKTIHIDDSFGEGLIGQAYLLGEEIYMNNVPQGYTEITSGLGDATPHCVLIMPLMVNDNVEGVIEIASFHDLQDYEVAFVKRLSESIATTIRAALTTERTKHLLESSQEQSELMRAQEEEMRQNMEELMATQEEMGRKQKELEELKNDLEKETESRTIELKETLERFKLALNGSSEAVFDIRVPDGSFPSPDDQVWWSPQVFELLQLDEDSFDPTFNGFEKLIHPDFVEELNTALYEFWRQGTENVFAKKVQISVKNEYIWFELSGSVSRNEHDKVIRFAGTLRDVNAQELFAQQQELIKNQDSTFNSIINNTEDWVMMVDKNYKVVMGNEAIRNNYFKKIKGVELELGKTSFLEIVTPSSADKFKYLIDETFKGESFVEEYSYETPNGFVIYLYISFNPVKDQHDNIIGVSANAKNITQIKLEQQEAKRSHRQMESILDQYDAEVYLKDAQGVYRVVDKLFCDKVGKTKEEIIGKKDRDLFKEAKAKKIAALDASIIQNLKTEKFDVKRSNGNIYRYVKFPILDQNGQAELMCSIAYDLTEEINALEGINKEKQLIDGLEGVVLQRKKDALDTFEYVGGNVAQLLEVSQEELKEKGMSAVLNGNDISKVYEKAIGSLEVEKLDDNTFTLKYPVQTKSGKLKLIMEKGKLNKDSHGEEFVESILTDITVLRPNDKN